MKKILATILVAIIIASTITLYLSSQAWGTLADVPIELRDRNYNGVQGEGSCAYAAVATAMRWVGLHDTADWWVAVHGDGATIYDIMERLDAIQIPYAATTTGDVAFLEWATRNRFPVVIFHSPIAHHCVNLVDLTDTEMVILDNRWPNRYDRYPRAEKIAQWRRMGPDEVDINSSGWALVIMGTPAPPWPAQEPWK